MLRKISTKVFQCFLNFRGQGTFSLIPNVSSFTPNVSRPIFSHLRESIAFSTDQENIHVLEHFYGGLLYVVEISGNVVVIILALHQRAKLTKRKLYWCWNLTFNPDRVKNWLNKWNNWKTKCELTIHFFY